MKASRLSVVADERTYAPMKEESLELPTSAIEDQVKSPGRPEFNPFSPIKEQQRGYSGYMYWVNSRGKGNNGRVLDRLFGQNGGKGKSFDLWRYLGEIKLFPIGMTDLLCEEVLHDEKTIEIQIFGENDSGLPGCQADHKRAHRRTDAATASRRLPAAV